MAYYFLGLTRRGHKRHILPKNSVRALCRQPVTVETNWNTGEPIALASHWLNETDMCLHCFDAYLQLPTPTKSVLQWVVPKSWIVAWDE